MKAMTGALASLLILTGATVAMAANTTGVIKTVDPKAMTFTLEDGKIYKADKALNLAMLKPGERVKVIFHVKNGGNVASAVSAM
jgi:hypothetical protein